MRTDPEPDWDFYYCTVNGAPSSILVDLAAIQRAPVSGKPWLLWVRWKLLSLEENGFPSPEEAHKLYALEDTLDEKLDELTDAEPAGRITGGHQRECFFYDAGPSHLERAVAKVRELFPEYSIECGARHDPDWRYYRDFLYPAHHDLRRIHTRRVVLQLDKHGDDHSIARPVDHVLYFRTPADRRGFTSLAQKAGFKVRLENTQRAGERHYRVNIVRDDPVELDHIEQVVEQLVEWAERFDGDYEGWGSPICAPEAPPQD